MGSLDGAHVRVFPYDATILSSSPERFLRVDGRFGGDEADQGHRAGWGMRVRTAACRARQADFKERAENLMIGGPDSPRPARCLCPRHGARCPALRHRDRRNCPQAPGILGFIAVDGRAGMSVVGRTAVIRNSEISVGAGGAITSLSRKDGWNEVRPRWILSKDP
ncbi:hypothetical protein PCANC_25423 [Puccinia coronata f. sp. avenae]|uniref:Uncharacterized protein n=1 Tax=Puccinia coronata f. sp. avenae TaxID=200324 RepID=A0A2N5S2H8_9BASI|nr:hypothetical protein PCANC_26161 [Puccinia coronata f. sp. avenae]PLW26573.1 hypothetical protein PCANC_25423 [Puccinia coronata f. sp. avenae]